MRSNPSPRPRAAQEITAQRLPPRSGVAALLASALVIAAPAAAQTGPRLIDTGRQDQLNPDRNQLPAGTRVPGAATIAVPRDVLSHISFVLKQVVLTGDARLAPPQWRQAWAPYVGKRIGRRAILQIAARIGAAYGQAGYPLYAVSIPPQNLADGVLTLQVTVGYVEGVTIIGDTHGANLDLLRYYAARIVADRPLRRATLERQILLMNDIAGLKVGSRFIGVPGKPAVARLLLAIRRHKFGISAAVNNAGAAQLSQSQFSVSAEASSVFREGDHTQLTYGFPSELGRYQYYGLKQIEPIGTNGATLTFSGAFLHTSATPVYIGGDATTLGVTASYPVIRSVHQSLYVSAGIDGLNSNSAFLGTNLSDERTRAARLSVTGIVQQNSGAAEAAALVISQGINGLGARRGNIDGDPGFTKLTLRLVYNQPLPWHLQLRSKFSGQYADARVPSSEEYGYGGLDFGLAFDSDVLTGDDGIAQSEELAWQIPAHYLPPFLAGSEFYAGADYGRIWWRSPLGLLPTVNDGASAGLGVRWFLFRKIALQLGEEQAVIRPRVVPGVSSHRFLVSVISRF